MNSRNIAFAIREALRESGVDLGFNHLQIIKKIIDEYISEDNTVQQNMHRTGYNVDHDMMLYAGVETCPSCHQSTRPPVM